MNLLITIQWKCLTSESKQTNNLIIYKRKSIKFYVPLSFFNKIVHGINSAKKCKWRIKKCKGHIKVFAFPLLYFQIVCLFNFRGHAFALYCDKQLHRLFCKCLNETNALCKVFNFPLLCHKWTILKYIVSHDQHKTSGRVFWVVAY